MIGFQTDPGFQDWADWIYLETAFAGAATDMQIHCVYSLWIIQKQVPYFQFLAVCNILYYLHTSYVHVVNAVSVILCVEPYSIEAAGLVLGPVALLLEILLRFAVLGCREFWCGVERLSAEIPLCHDMFFFFLPWDRWLEDFCYVEHFCKIGIWSNAFNTVCGHYGIVILRCLIVSNFQLQKYSNNLMSKKSFLVVCFKHSVLMFHPLTGP